MKTNTYPHWYRPLLATSQRGLLLLPWLVAVASQAQFNSGSDGSFGEIVVNSGEQVVLDVPDDGVFHATTVTIRGTLSFNPNARNTAVRILAQGDIVLDNGNIQIRGSDGSSTLGGKGGPGGFDGGRPGAAGLPPGAGMGPGGGLPETESEEVGAGAYGGLPSGDSPRQGSTYGNALLIPIVGGSGGGGTFPQGGGGGGGAIELASNTQIIIRSSGQFNINARGGNAHGANHGGSGGAIRIVAPKVSGNGRFEYRGGAAVQAVGNAGHGRMRVDTLDASELNFTFSPAAARSIGAFMVVNPQPAPRLDIVEAAGQAIELDSGPVLVTLPLNENPNQQVVVQASNFRGLLPITVALFPDQGDPLFIEAEIDMAAGNPASTTVTAEFPTNTRTLIQAWTRR